MKKYTLILVGIIAILNFEAQGQSLKLSRNLKEIQKINNERLELKNNYNQLTKDSQAIFNLFNNTDIKLEDTTNIEKSKSAIEGLGDIVISSAIVVPNLKILANTSTSLKSYGFYAGINIYGLQKINENSIEDNAINILMKEPSYWGIGLDGTVLLNAVNDNFDFLRLGINFNIDYTSRKISTALKDSISKFIEPSSNIVKVGGELIFKDILSVYFNYNSNTILTGINDFQEYFGTTRSKFEYLDLGFRCVLDIKNKDAKNQSSVYIDLSFLFVNSSIEKFTGINDRVVPMLRINFNHPIFKS